jgi:hypothetical protein
MQRGLGSACLQDASAAAAAVLHRCSHTLRRNAPRLPQWLHVEDFVQPVEGSTVSSSDSSSASTITDGGGMHWYVQARWLTTWRDRVSWWHEGVHNGPQRKHGVMQVRCRRAFQLGPQAVVLFPEAADLLLALFQLTTGATALGGQQQQAAAAWAESISCAPAGEGCRPHP